MASILPQCQYHSHSVSDYIFCNQFCEDFPPPLAAGNSHVNGGAAAMWVNDDNGLPFFDNGAALDMVPPESDFPDRFGVVSDMAVVPVLPPEFNMAGSHIFELGGGPGYHHPQEDGFMPDFWTVHPVPNHNQGGFEVPLVPTLMEEQEPTMKVGRYSVEERKDRILRYLKKRNHRNFNKTIKYACRKTLADKRVRVRGRFARNNDLLCEEEQAVLRKNNNNNNPDQEYHQEREFYNDDDTLKIKHDGEDWLQEAMASLIYLPYISG